MDIARLSVYDFHTQIGESLMNIPRARGTRDLLDETLGAFLRIENAARSVFERFGYQPIRIPIFERAELFIRSVGEETDIVSKEMYTFQDRGGRDLTLRPEGTAGTARAAIDNGLLSRGEARKFYYIGPMFRYERPQAGRYREFWQTGIESFGSNDPLMDAETILCAQFFLDELDIAPVRIRLNSVGSGERHTYADALKQHLQPHFESLGPQDKARFEGNALRLLDSKDPNTKRLLEDAPSILDFLSDESRAHLDAVQNALDDIGVEYELDSRIVRGLDYYTGTVFEISADGLGAQDVVVGGGRYNGLIEQLGGKSTPGVGFAAGIDRLVLAMSAQESPQETSQPIQVWIAAIGEEARPKAFALLNKIRQKGLRADMDYQGRGIRSQLKTANRLNAPYAVILGEDELARGEAALKNMSDGTQESAPLDETAERLRQCLDTQP